MKQGLFLDRDGVINVDHGYVHRIDEVQWRPQIFTIARAAQDRGFVIVVVTNQAGIGRGYYSLEAFHCFDVQMHRRFAEEGIRVAQTYFCPEHPDHGVGHFRRASWRRKPGPGMLVEACNDHNINPRLSLMIGDQDSDREAARAVGVARFVDARQPDWQMQALRALSF